MRFNKSSAKPRAIMETHKRSASTSTTPVKKIRLSPVRLSDLLDRSSTSTSATFVSFHGCTWFGTTLIKAHNVNT